jgi:protein tyrosine phosphatase (PTP) superfamily phosphohydrolase (DUF442 family)
MSRKNGSQLRDNGKSIIHQAPSRESKPAPQTASEGQIQEKLDKDFPFVARIVN